jgi:uncharacterized membrane protein YkvA (DUF1232 family)
VIDIGLMPLLLRIAAVSALWLFSKRPKATTSSFARATLDSLAWPDKLRLVWALTRDKRVPTLARAVLLAPAAYLLSPIDLLPDFVPFLGRLDDALVFSVAMDLAAHLIPAQIFEQHLTDVSGKPRASQTR